METTEKFGAQLVTRVSSTPKGTENIIKYKKKNICKNTKLLLAPKKKTTKLMAVCVWAELRTKKKKGIAFVYYIS